MTPLTIHQVMVLYSGTAFFLSGLLILGCWQMLGPRYVDQWSLGPKRRLLVFALGLMAITRGVTLIFPGRLVAVEHMSPIIPIWATSLLLTSAMIAELLTAQRFPPPFMDRVVSALSLPVQTYPGDPPPEDGPEATVRLSSARLRLVAIAGSVAGLIIVLGVMLHAAAATLPAR